MLTRVTAAAAAARAAGQAERARLLAGIGHPISGDPAAWDPVTVAKAELASELDSELRDPSPTPSPVRQPTAELVRVEAAATSELAAIEAATAKEMAQIEAQVARETEVEIARVRIEMAQVLRAVREETALADAAARAKVGKALATETSNAANAKVQDLEERDTQLRLTRSRDSETPNSRDGKQSTVDLATVDQVTRRIASDTTPLALLPNSGNRLRH